LSPLSRCNLNLVPGGYDWPSNAFDSSNNLRALACGVFDSPSVSSVVP
jgi:hypothetical protein